LANSKYIVLIHDDSKNYKTNTIVCETCDKIHQRNKRIIPKDGSIFTGNYCENCGNHLMIKLVKDQQIVDNQMMGKTYYQIKRADLIIVLDTKYNSQYSYLF
jgi:NAD-dependent SIR2 family protein deacetylase